MSVEPANYWYLASPYSHPDPSEEAWRAEMAVKASAELWRLARPVFSPIAHGHPINQAAQVGGCWQTWAAFDVAMISNPYCLGVIVLKLPGWAGSEGLLAEVELALDLGKEVTCMEPVF